MNWRNTTKTAKSRLLISVFLLCFAGCGGGPGKKEAIETIRPSARVDLADSALVKRLLYSQLKEWRGAQYRLGGLSKTGIDCSGFAYVTFLTKLGIVLPRSTRSQARTGKEISGKELRPGDLVFFKTGPATRHVGIFLEKRRFIHAATSGGVTVSSLDNIYWANRLWKLKRIGQ